MKNILAYTIVGVASIVILVVAAYMLYQAPVAVGEFIFLIVFVYSVAWAVGHLAEQGR